MLMPLVLTFIRKPTMNKTAINKLLAFAALFLGMLSLPTHASYSQIQWVDLIPKADLDALLNPPQSIYNIEEGSAADTLARDPLANAVEQAIGDSIGKPVPNISPEEQAYFQALRSTNIRSEYNQKNIRIAGFVVPVEYDDNQTITEFFLVPWFGACIHTPPPPPNQIIYVKYPKGLKLDALYEPFWVEGKLLAELVENELALSAYTLNAKAVKTYDSYQH